MGFSGLGALCAASVAGLKLTEPVEIEGDAEKIKLTDSDIAYVSIHILRLNDTHNPELIRKIKALILDEVSFSNASGVVDDVLVSRVLEIQKQYNLQVDGEIGKNTILIIKGNFE